MKLKHLKPDTEFMTVESIHLNSYFKTTDIDGVVVKAGSKKHHYILNLNTEVELKCNIPIQKSTLTVLV